MANICNETGVKIITGDTKVDKIIITGGIGEHGTTIATERYNIKVKGNIKSDCMPLNNILDKIGKYMDVIKLMKDPTRGGLATSLNEIAEVAKMGIHLIEESIPIKDEVTSVNQLLGLDPLYLACEGRMVLVVAEKDSEIILEEIRKCEGCKDSAIIGSVVDSGHQPIVFIETCIGGKRIIGPLEGGMLPRIC